MNRHLNFVTLICLITGFVSLASCSNDDDEMDKYQKIYIRTGVAPGAEMGAAVVVDCVSNSSTADRSDFEIQLCRTAGYAGCHCRFGSRYAESGYLQFCQ